jgi:MFS family permease
LVAGQTVSQLGDKLHHMALIALVGAGATAQTGGLELAKLSAVFTLPVVLLGPLAGAMVDRWNKRLTMIACDLLRALLVGAIPWVYAASGHLWSVYALAFVVFMLGLFFNSAKMALIPELVPRAELLSANASLTLVGRMATVAGILGGGIMISAPYWRRFGWTDYAAGFYLDAVSYVASVVALLAIGLVFRARSGGRSWGRRASPAGAATTRAPTRLIADAVATLRLVRHQPHLRFVFLSLVLLGLFASTAYVAMTLAVQTVMGKGTAGVGYLGGLLAAGMVVGSLLVGTVGRAIRREFVIIACTAVIGVLMLGAGLFFSFQAFAPVAVVGGALLAPIMVAQDTMLHEHAPSHARALIFSTRDLVLAAVFVVSSFVVGTAVYLFGRAGFAEPYRAALIVCGALITGVALLGSMLAVPRHSAPDQAR